MELIPCQKVVSKCGRAILFLENLMPAGAAHDFALEFKGYTVDIMVAAHKQEQEVSDAHKAQEEASCCKGE